eukprot:16452365-Heterocapsa_arctica.AAC.2
MWNPGAPCSAAQTAAKSSDLATVCLPGVRPLWWRQPPFGPLQAMAQEALRSQGLSGWTAEPSVKTCPVKQASSSFHSAACSALNLASTSSGRLATMPVFLAHHRLPADLAPLAAIPQPVARGLDRGAAEAAQAGVVLPLVDLFLADDAAHRHGAESPFRCGRKLDLPESRGPRPVIYADLHSFGIFPALQLLQAVVLVVLQKEVPPNLSGLEQGFAE